MSDVAACSAPTDESAIIDLLNTRTNKELVS
jgi:hypothetical protein